MTKRSLTWGNESPPERFADSSTGLSITADLQVIDAYDSQTAALERHLLKNAKVGGIRSSAGLTDGPHD
jgi:hypothetical protein